MASKPSRRELIAGSLGLAPALRAANPAGPIVETNAHIYSELERFPFHPNRTYTPAPIPLDGYLRFLRETQIGPVVIVHPSPYQDDHRSLEHYLEHEPSPGFFKGTCLFDATDPKTPARMKELAGRHPGRIKALRIFEDRKAGAPPTNTGTIRDRDLRDPVVKQVWQVAGSLDMTIQMVAIPGHAPQIAALASAFRNVPVIIDHLGRPKEGTPAEYEKVLKLGRLPQVYMKFTSIRSGSREEYPHRDIKPIARRIYDAFGPDRIMWGTLGTTLEQFQKNVTVFEMMFDFIPEAERAKIRGLNAIKLFGFKNAKYLMTAGITLLWRSGR